MFYDFITKYTEIFLLKKMREFFSTKNIGIFEILRFEILTKCELMTSLVLEQAGKSLQSRIR